MAGSLDLQPLGTCIGAEVKGLDLRAPPDCALAEALDAALAEHIVLVLRGQSLTPEQYRAAMSTLGEPMYQHREKFNLPECREVSRVTNRDGFPPAIHWHTDHTNHEIPPKYTVLYSVQIPASGGDTAFANMAAALETLPAAERRALGTLYTLNNMEPDGGYSQKDRARHPGGVRHPLVRVHPATRRQALYFHVSKSQGIEGMAPGAVKPFLQSLLDRTIRPEITYRHRWRAGDLVICDNRAAMHRVYPDSAPGEPRLLWRMILKGERPIGPADRRRPH